MKKIAIGIAGEYSDVFLRNSLLFKTTINGPVLREGIDLFVFSFSEIPKVFQNFCVKSIYNPENPYITIPQYNKVLISNKNFVLHHFSYQQCLGYICENEENSHTTYDHIYFTTFRNIILDLEPPQTPANRIEKIVYSQTLEMMYPSYFDSIEVLSAKIVNWNGLSCEIYSLPPEIRSFFFSIFFNNQVIEYKDFQQNYTKQFDLTFIVPSVVSTSDKDLDCAEYRSIFTVSERLQQTIRQLTSIQKQIDCSLLKTNVVVCEGSQLDLYQLIKLSSTTAQIVLFATDTLGFLYANEHPNKSIYEVYVMKNMISKINSKWYFKFGARYYLSQFFNIQNMLKSRPVFKKIDGPYTFTKEPLCQAVIYSFPYSYRSFFDHMYISMLDTLTSKMEFIAIENELYRHLCDEDIHWASYFGVVGYDALFSKLNII